MQSSGTRADRPLSPMSISSRAENGHSPSGGRKHAKPRSKSDETSPGSSHSPDSRGGHSNSNSKIKFHLAAGPVIIHSPKKKLSSKPVLTPRSSGASSDNLRRSSSKDSLRDGVVHPSVLEGTSKVEKAPELVRNNSAREGKEWDEKVGHSEKGSAEAASKDGHKLNGGKETSEERRMRMANVTFLSSVGRDLRSQKAVWDSAKVGQYAAQIEMYRRQSRGSDGSLISESEQDSPSKRNAFRNTCPPIPKAALMAMLEEEETTETETTTDGTETGTETETETETEIEAGVETDGGAKTSEMESGSDKSEGDLARLKEGEMEEELEELERESRGSPSASTSGRASPSVIGKAKTTKEETSPSSFKVAEDQNERDPLAHLFSSKSRSKKHLKDKSSSLRIARVKREDRRDRRSGSFSLLSKFGDPGPSQHSKSNALSNSSLASSAFCSSPALLYPHTPRQEEELTEEQRQRKEAIDKSLATFNNGKPVHALRALIHDGVLPDDAVMAARFLHQFNHKLDKVHLGTLLAENDEWCQQVLLAYIDQMDFSFYDFDVALRKLLYTFRLPGEAQRIDRIVKAWANRWFEQNPGLLPEPKCAYVLAYAVIMLNTDAHHASVKNKMTLKEFIVNVQHNNGGELIPHKVLEDIYPRIVEEEIKMQDDGALFPSATKKGWLNVKPPGPFAVWKQRWTVLTHDKIHFLRKIGDERPILSIPLDGLLLNAPMREKKSKKHLLRLHHGPPEYGAQEAPTYTLDLNDRLVTLVSTMDRRVYDHWVASINRNIGILSKAARARNAAASNESLITVSPVSVSENAQPEKQPEGVEQQTTVLLRSPKAQTLERNVSAPLSSTSSGESPSHSPRKPATSPREGNTMTTSAHLHPTAATKSSQRRSRSLVTPFVPPGRENSG